MFSVSDFSPPHIPFKFRRKSSSASNSPPLLQFLNNDGDEDRDMSSSLPPSSPLSPIASSSGARYRPYVKNTSNTSIYDHDDPFDDDADVLESWLPHYARAGTSKRYPERPIPIFPHTYGSHLGSNDKSPVSEHAGRYGLSQNHRWAALAETEASIDDEDSSDYDPEGVDIHVRETYFTTSAERGRWQSSPIPQRTRAAAPFGSSPIRPMRLRSTPVKGKDVSDSTIRDHTRRHSTSTVGDQSTLPLFFTATDDDLDVCRSSSPLPPSSIPASPMSLSPSNLDDDLFEDDMVLDEADFSYDSDSRRDDIKPPLSSTRHVSAGSPVMPTNSLPVAVESISPEHLDPPSPRLSTMSSRRSSLSMPPPDNSLPINVSIPNRIDQTCATVKPSIRPLERQPPLTNMKNKLHPGESRESRLHWDVVMAVDISMLPPTSLSAGLEKPEQVIQPPDVTGTSVASANDEELVENPVKEEVQVLQLTRTETSPLSDCPAASVEKESFSSLPEDKKLSIADDSVSVVAQSLTITDPVVSFAATQKHIQRKSSSISISDNAVDPAMSIPSTLTPSVSHNQAVFKNSAISVSVESKAKSKARSKSKREKEPIDEREAGPSEPPRKKRRRSNGVESKDSKTMNSSRHRDHGVDTQRNADSRCSGDSDCKARSDCTPGTSNIRAKGKAKSRSRSRPPEENLADALARICDDRTPSSPPPQPTGPKKKSKSSPPIGASSPKHEETRDEIAQQKLCSELTGMLIESLATSRASSLTPTVLYKTITQSHPHLKTEERTKKAWIQLISDVLELGGMFEKVESSGEDGEARWFYVPERDEDQERAGLISALMPRQKRNETKKYKQYYYQPLDRISRWDPEDAP